MGTLDILNLCSIQLVEWKSDELSEMLRMSLGRRLPYIAGNFGKVFNLAILLKIAKLKNLPILFRALLHYAEALTNTKII